MHANHWSSTESVILFEIILYLCDRTGADYLKQISNVSSENTQLSIRLDECRMFKTMQAKSTQ